MLSSPESRRDKALGWPDFPKAKRHKAKGDRSADHRDQNDGSQHRERAIALGTAVRRLVGGSEGLLRRGRISSKLAVFTPH